MKRKNLIYAILPLLLAVFVLQSCKEEEPIPQVFYAFTEPTAVSPLDGTLIKITGTTAELKWASTDADGDAPVADVYFGEAANPPLFKAANAGLAITVPLTEGKTYYWKITMYDANKVMTYGPIWHFSVAVAYDITNFVGVFDCNEPGYGHYNCNFTKVSATTVSSDNFWDSGWAVSYVFDDYGNVNITPVSYVDKGVTYDITGTGKFDNKAKSFYVNYLVKNHATGATVDSNTHTFVKK
jgi:hypothetical protein